MISITAAVLGLAGLLVFSIIRHLIGMRMRLVLLEYHVPLPFVPDIRPKGRNSDWYYHQAFVASGLDRLHTNLMKKYRWCTIGILVSFPVCIIGFANSISPEYNRHKRVKSGGTYSEPRVSVFEVHLRGGNIYTLHEGKGLGEDSAALGIGNESLLSFGLTDVNGFNAREHKPAGTGESGAIAPHSKVGDFTFHKSLADRGAELEPTASRRRV